MLWKISSSRQALTPSGGITPALMWIFDPRISPFSVEGRAMQVKGWSLTPLAGSTKNGQYAARFVT